MAMREYLVGEVAEEYAEGLLSRREAVRRLGLLGVALPGATALLAACGGDDDDAEAEGPQATPAGPVTPAATPPPGKDVGKLITYTADGQRFRAAYKAAAKPKGAVLVIHENKGLTTHFFELVGRMAANGYSALCVDLLSREGKDGLAGFDDQAAATAALSAMPAEQLLGDLRSAADELLERAGDDLKLGAMGFCFGGGMTWNLLQKGPGQERRLRAAIPFYGPAPAEPDFTGSRAAVLGMFAGDDERVNGTMAAAEEALQTAKLTYEIKVWDGAQHAFFNDTGERYDETATTAAQKQLLAWFDKHLA
ncbi:dienelactone hydrolase family protein [Sporichthya polymorpha]|uniref:dienelactone hydrolase family protein n=1 Tax=Sporichthya polymorpha TaxID=35751 RepID=UPI00036AB833|nr:dienelactone hydrolase family protein [Sporichthya polymorpha]